jgi:hypothetical protein
VPKITGYTVGEARKLLLENGLRFVGASEPSGPFLQPDHEEIYDQKPKATTYVKKGTCIYVETRTQAMEAILQNLGTKEFAILLIKKFDSNKDYLTGEIKEEDVFYEGVGSYRGEYKDGLPHGEGKFTVTSDDVESGLKKGTSYDGHWENGYMHGEGTYTLPDGSYYHGNIANNKQEGKGTFIWESGNQYAGNWVNDIMEGEGTFTWKNGNQYSGNWVNGHMEGQGTFTWVNGDKYIGPISDVRHGIGKHIFSESGNLAGDSIEGRYVNGLHNGRGTYTYADGRYDIGTWKDHKKNGTFLCYDAEDQLLCEKKYVDGNVTSIQYVNQEVTQP